jgi:hypothetical protein
MQYAGPTPESMSCLPVAERWQSVGSIGRMLETANGASEGSRPIENPSVALCQQEEGRRCY